MGNGNSKDNAPEAPGLIGKLGGIPRAAAITEGRRAKGGQPKLPPNAIRSQAEDWAFIEVLLHLNNDCIPTFTFASFGLHSSMPAIAPGFLHCSQTAVYVMLKPLHVCHHTFLTQFIYPLISQDQFFPRYTQQTVLSRPSAVSKP